MAEPVEKVRTSQDVIVSKVGRDLYEKFFRNYTRKQWGLDPSELDASVTARVPVRTNRDDRYFSDAYQAMPLHGYTKMFERMTRAPQHQGPPQRQLPRGERDDPTPPDDLHRPGRRIFRLSIWKAAVPVAGVRFQTHHRPVFQPAPVVNFPNDNAYTRCTEFKYLTGQEHSSTTRGL